jgi:hypothetical protein
MGFTIGGEATKALDIENITTEETQVILVVKT